MGAAGSGRVAFEKTDIGKHCEALEDVRWMITDATDALRELDEQEAKVRRALDILHVRRNAVRRLLLAANLRQAGIEQGLGMPYLQIQRFRDELERLPAPTGDVAGFMDRIRADVREKATA